MRIKSKDIHLVSFIFYLAINLWIGIYVIAKN